MLAETEEIRRPVHVTGERALQPPVGQLTAELGQVVPEEKPEAFDGGAIGGAGWSDDQF
jgi:hypothetical protein